MVISGLADVEVAISEDLVERQPGDGQQDRRPRAAGGDSHREGQVMHSAQAGDYRGPPNTALRPLTNSDVTVPVTYMTLLVKAPLPGPVGCDGARARHSKSPPRHSQTDASCRQARPDLLHRQPRSD